MFAHGFDDGFVEGVFLAVLPAFFGDVLLAILVQLFDLSLDLFTLGGFLIEVGLTFVSLEGFELGGEIVFLDLFQFEPGFFVGVHEVPAGVAVVGASLGEGALDLGSFLFVSGGIVVLGAHVGRATGTVFAIDDVGLVQLDAETGDFFVLGGLDVNDGLVLINGEEAAFGEGGPGAPAAVFAFALLAAVDGIDDDAFLDGLLAGFLGIDGPLGEGLVASDEDGLVGLAIFVPGELVERIPDDGAAEFAAAVGGELEELLGDSVEVSGEWQDLADVVGADAEIVIAVLVEGDLDDGDFIPLFGVVEFIDDFPELAFGLLNEAVHAVTGIQEDGNLDEGLIVTEGIVRDGFGCGAGDSGAGDEGEDGMTEGA